MPGWQPAAQPAAWPTTTSPTMPQTYPQQPGSAPLGAARPNSVSIDAYKPPKRPWVPLIAFLMGFALLIGGFMLVDHYSRETAATEASDAPSSSSTLSGLPFAGSSSTGVWEITDTRWYSDRVVVTLSLTVTTGALRYTFYAYTNATAKVAYPDTATSSVLEPGKLSAGETAIGTLTLRIAPGDATLILADSANTPVSGLAIKV